MTKENMFTEPMPGLKRMLLVKDNLSCDFTLGKVHVSVKFLHVGKET